MKIRYHLFPLSFAPLMSEAALAQPPVFIPQDGVVQAQVNNVPARLLVSPAGLDNPAFSSDYVARAHISSDLLGGLVGLSVKIGKVSISGKTGIARMAIANSSERRRVVWFDRPIAPGFDGEVGPGAMPASKLTFMLGTAHSGERVITVPMVTKQYFKGTQMNIAGQRVFVLWDPHRQTSLVTAATAQALAFANSGAFVGTATAVRVKFDVSRPVRQMRLQRPLTVPGGTLSSLMVRISDFGSIAGIPDADADPNEIVVNGRTGNAKPVYLLTLGRDAIANCSSMTYDMSAKAISLSCR